MVIRARRGDQAAWLEIVALHQQGVFRMAYLKLGEAAEAEDIAQDTFVRAFRKLHQFEPDRPLRPWLLGICVNLCRNRWRSLDRYKAAIRRWAQRVEIERESADHSDRFVSDERLWQFIRRLRPSDQDVLYFRFFMDLTIEETASLLKVAAGTVKSRQHRALSRLRGLILSEAPEMMVGNDV